jgi:hypothetical protein
VTPPAFIRRFGTFNDDVKLTHAKCGDSRPSADPDRFKIATSDAGCPLVVALSPSEASRRSFPNERGDGALSGSFCGLYRYQKSNETGENNTK